MRTLSERDEMVARSMASFLKDASASLRKELISQREGAVPSTLFPAR